MANTLPDNWNKLTPEQKLDWRLAAWSSPEGKPLNTPQAVANFTAATRRYIDVLKLREPDRVPRTLILGDYVAHYAGSNPGEFFYDYPKAIAATIKFCKDFDIEYGAGGNFMPGKLFDRLGYRLYRWPGGALAPTQGFQFVEGEYMTADEYDALIADPESFAMRVFTPRVMGALGGLGMVPSFFGTVELPFVPFMLAGFSAPPTHEAFKALLEANQIVLEWFGANAQLGAVTLGEMGLPGTMGGFSKAPFDYLGDSLRGTRGIMMDMYRRPAKVLAAVERLVPMAIQMGVGAANGSGTPFAMLPLHKGADGFMSNADFKKFYWPTLKATIEGIAQEGVVPVMFVEGGYNQRLDIIAESGLPKAATMWIFDQTDMAQAKAKFGSWACIGGNVPASLFKAGTPEQIGDYVKKLVDVCAPGGGFFLSPGAVLDQAKAENVHAYLKTAKELGVYR